jgi:hypothetical protein
VSGKAAKINKKKKKRESGKWNQIQEFITSMPAVPRESPIIPCWNI